MLYPSSLVQCNGVERSIALLILTCDEDTDYNAKELTRGIALVWQLLQLQLQLLQDPNRTAWYTVLVATLDFPAQATA